MIKIEISKKSQGFENISSTPNFPEFFENISSTSLEFPDLDLKGGEFNSNTPVVGFSR